MFAAPPPSPVPPAELWRAEQLTRELANELMSPYCPGRTISSCPSEQARKLEDWILERAQAGDSRETIEQTLVQRFGEDKLGSKDDPTVLYGSLLAAALGALVLFAAARRWLRAPRGRSQTEPATAAAGRAQGPAPTRAERDGLEDALDELEEF